ncbi:MAG: response regulator transcription factor [Saprospiraceae bacterium]|nr:response regulator transcription factor [Saprospiraceae bacterium]
MNKNTIRIAIAEDQQLFRECLVSILNGFEHLNVVVQASNGKHLLSELTQLETPPDVVLMDLSMPELNGMDTTKLLKKDYPDIKIVILSVHSEERHIVRLVGMGVNGYLLKNTELSEVVKAVEAVAEKGFYFNESILRAIQQGMGQKQQKQFNPEIPLTAREKEVLELICRELTTNEIADKLYLSIRTVDGHRNNLLEKTGSRNTAGLVLYAVKNGLFEVEP